MATINNKFKLNPILHLGKIKSVYVPLITFVYRGSSHRRKSAACPKLDMVWLNLSPIPVGRRGVISSYKWCLLHVEEGRRESAPCVCSPYRCTTCLRSGGESGGGGGLRYLPLLCTPCVISPDSPHTPPFSNLRHLIANSAITDNFGNFLRRLAFAKASAFLYIYWPLSISAGTALPYTVHPQWRQTISFGGFCILPQEQG